MSSGDEIDPLQVRLQAKEAALVAERRRREAAEANAVAAQAAADELRLALHRAGVRPPRRLFRLLLLAVVPPVALILGGLLGGLLWLQAERRRDRDRLDEARLEISTLSARALNTEGALRQSEKEAAAALRRERACEAARAAELGREPVPPAQEPSGPADPLLRRAQAAYADGEHKLAVALARRVLAVQPDHLQALSIVGASSCYVKDAAEAQRVAALLPVGSRNLLRQVCRSSGIAIP